MWKIDGASPGEESFIVFTVACKRKEFVITL